MTTITRKISTATGHNLATVTAEVRSANGPGAECLGTLSVSVYWHTPEGGEEPYLVVDVDDDDTDTGLAVYLNDGQLFKNESNS